MRAASVEPLSLLMTVERIGVIRFRSGASPWLRDLARCPSFQDVGLAIPYPRHRIIKPNVAHSVCVRRAERDARIVDAGAAYDGEYMVKPAVWEE